MKFITLIILFVLLVSGCSFSQKTKIKEENKNKITNKEKIVDEKKNNKEEIIDYDKFELIGCKLGKYNKKIYTIRPASKSSYDYAHGYYGEETAERGYFAYKRIWGVDTESFEFLKENDYSCYVKDKNKAFYLKKGGGLNTVSVTEIVGADVKSFEAYDFDFYSRDNNFVYYKTKKVTDADPNTFGVVEDPYPYKKIKKRTKDKSSIFFLGKKIKNSDSKTFSFTGNIAQSSYAKDKNQVYFFNETTDKLYLVEGADPSTFSTLFKGNVYMYGKDKKNIFYREKKMPKVDIGSFEILFLLCSKDKNKAYFQEKIIEKADGSTFEEVGNWYWKDKNNVFYRYEFKYPESIVKKIDEADVETFKAVKDCHHVAKDKNYVYKKGEIIEGADPFGFKCD